jgi:acyl-coenzyme A thioesterase PaaI-like protein
MGWAPALEWSRQPPGLVSTFQPGLGDSGRPGYLHGGLAATLLDETMAALSWATDREHSVTATLSLRYRLPVPVDGGPLRMEAWYADARPRRVRKVHGRLLLADGTPAVEATGLFVRVSADAGDD